MPDINKVVLLGTVDREPELKTLPTGKSLCAIRMATRETWLGRDGKAQERSEFHRVTLWGPKGEAVYGQIKAGLKLGPVRVRAEGRLSTRKWEKEGQTHYSTEVVAHAVEVLDESEIVPVTDEGLPF